MWIRCQNCEARIDQDHCGLLYKKYSIARHVDCYVFL